MVANNEIQIRLPHRLTQQEAAQRLRTGLDQMAAKYGDKLTSSDLKWETDTRLVGAVQALGATVSGTIEVLPQEVVITARLPWLLSMLKDKITSFATRKGAQLLLK